MVKSSSSSSLVEGQAKEAAFDLPGSGRTRISMVLTETPWLLPADAFVLPADSQGGGLTGAMATALRKVVGKIWESLQSEANSRWITGAFSAEQPFLLNATNFPGIKADQIIVATAFTGKGDVQASLAVEAILRLAASRGIKRLVLPRLGTGYGGQDPVETAETMYRAIAQTESGLDHILIATLSEAAFVRMRQSATGPLLKRAETVVSDFVRAHQCSLDDRVTRIMVLAGNLAPQRDPDRREISTSLILFSLLESRWVESSGGALDEVGLSFVNAIRAATPYPAVRNRYFNDHEPSIRFGEGVFSIEKLSDNAQPMLMRACSYAWREGAVVRPSHLAAALITETTGAVHARIGEMGIDFASIKAELGRVVWRMNETLSASNLNSFVAGAPGYTSEFCGVGGTAPVPDHLGVAGLAQRLAELIALRETKLPLAVGLFANWGSGKSHFMNLMDRHMKTLAADPESSWCKEIVPIYFNAWHYSDSNLWASLVTEVFDALFARLKDKTDEMGLLQARLREAGGVAALAAEEDLAARGGVREAEAALNKARAEGKSAKGILRSMLRGLQSERVTELLGVAPAEATLAELEAKREELNSLAGSARQLWKKAFSRRGLRQRIAWFSGVLLGALLILLVPHVHPAVRSGIIVIAPLIASMVPVLRHFRSGLRQLDIWLKKAEEDPEVQDAEEKVRHAEAQARAKESAVATARSRELDLKKEAEELRPERRLSRFLEGRARSADYRGQLGLVSLARRDFSELSAIFADTEALRRMKENSPEDAEKLGELSRSIDRVVLFIDDLDRCEPEKVVDVLQAVHLLLAYPLFAVVVGVDQRCLKQSLRMRFKGLLTSDRGDGADSHELPATPLDYLEKIFHIPFHLPSMGKTGFENLVEELTTTKGLKERREEPTSAPAQSGAEPAPVQTSAPPTNASPVTSNRSDPLPTEFTPSPKSPDRPVGSVPLERWERDALKEYYSLIQTPRGATRLLNTYRLVRAGIAEKDWDQFRGGEGGSGEYRVPMLLLAVAAGRPAVAREWFQRLRQMDALPAPTSADSTSLSEWENFIQLYDSAGRQTNAPLSKDRLTEWLDQVEQFSF